MSREFCGSSFTTVLCWTPGVYLLEGEGQVMLPIPKVLLVNKIQIQYWREEAKGLEIPSL